MTRFLARRLLNYLLLLALASFLTFSLTSVSFTPLESLEGRNPRPPQAVIDAKAAELDLDKPIPLRYAHWAAGAIHGDFGTTVAGQPVSDELGRRIGVSLRLLIIGSVLGATLGVLIGAWSAVRRAANLAPAEAMRSESPKTYRVTFVERLGLQSFFSQQSRMILRQLERQPVRVLMATMAIAFSVALVIAGNYFRDAIDMLVDVQFRRIQQEDATVAFTHPMTLRALRELEHVQGVLYAEPLRVLPIRLVSAHRSRRSAVQGLPHERTLRQLLDVKLRPIYLPKDGIVMTKELAASLHVTAGSSVELQILEGARRTVQVTVHALVEELIGVAVYMDLDALTHLLGEASTVSAAYIAIEPGSTERVFQRLKESPNIASINRRETMLHIFRDTLGERLVDAFVPTAVHIATEGPLGWAMRGLCLRRCQRHGQPQYDS